MCEGDKCAALRTMSEAIENWPEDTTDFGRSKFGPEWKSVITGKLTERIALYYECKKRLATGCEPERVAAIRNVSYTTQKC